MMKQMLIAAMLAASAAGAAQGEEHAPGHSTHWTYSGKTGAPHWGDLQPDYATCKLGREQSPINIRGAVKADLPPIGFQYVDRPADVVNTGHTVQVNVPDGGAISLATGQYAFVQLHFHAPSEERINGKAYPLVAHLVHRNAAGKLAAIAVLFKEGKANPVLKRVFPAMPAGVNAPKPLPGGLNVADLLPADRGYYAFVGSLTTPPCSEDVQWRVLKQPVELSRAQLAAFKRLYPMNARPLQPLNARTIQASR